MEPVQRLCNQCHKPLKGRIDKKFCDDYCRNAFNNNLHSEQHTAVKKINNTLKRNRKILQELLPEGIPTARHPRSDLMNLGFHPQYHTHTYQNKKGDTYTFCYEYGFLALENDMVLIVRSRE